MIKFFRKIRQRLLTENKFSKYLIYAIGEIILVVIGILIAITLNNANQNKVIKADRDLKQIKLRELVYQDSIRFVHAMSFSQEKLKQGNELLALLESDLSLENYNEFIHLFNEIDDYRMFLPDKTIYNELVNSGEFSKIADVKIKEKISNLYNFYDFFHSIIINSTERTTQFRDKLFYDGILVSKYLDEDYISKEEAYLYFKSILADQVQFRILENYIYDANRSQKYLIQHYSVFINHMMNGIPLKPNE